MQAVKDQQDVISNFIWHHQMVATSLSETILALQSFSSVEVKSLLLMIILLMHSGDRGSARGCTASGQIGLVGLL